MLRRLECCVTADVRRPKCLASARGASAGHRAPVVLAVFMRIALAWLRVLLALDLT